MFCYRVVSTPKHCLSCPFYNRLGGNIKYRTNSFDDLKIRIKKTLRMEPRIRLIVLCLNIINRPETDVADNRPTAKQHLLVNYKTN